MTSAPGTRPSWRPWASRCRPPRRTPAVARSAYSDPAVFERYQAGPTIAKALDDLGASADYGELATQGDTEAAVLRLLRQRS
jgi:hypothetical protein